MNAKLHRIEKRIVEIKDELTKIGPMRPGSLTRQTRGPKQVGGYYQLSYTRCMKGHTEYVRPEWVDQVQRQIATYHRFKQLVNEWISLAIKHSKWTITLAKRRHP